MTTPQNINDPCDELIRPRRLITIPSVASKNNNHLTAPGAHRARISTIVFFTAARSS